MIFTTEQIKDIYNLLSHATSNTLDSEDKMKVVKIRAILKPIATPYNDFEEDMRKELKPANFDEDSIKAPLFVGVEKMEWNLKVYKYSKELSEALKPALDKTHELEIEAISQEVYYKLEKENNWRMGAKDYFDPIIAQ